MMHIQKWSDALHNCDPEQYRGRAPSLRRKKDVLGFLQVTMIKKIHLPANIYGQTKT